MNLLIDDVRDESHTNCELHTIARNYFSGIAALTSGIKWDTLFLDHDLSTFDDDGKEWTGYDIMCFLEINPQFLPNKIVCVSSNPSGRARIEQVIKKLYVE